MITKSLSIIFLHGNYVSVVFTVCGMSVCVSSLKSVFLAVCPCNYLNSTAEGKRGEEERGRGEVEEKEY